jgi:hypothetical protein
MQQRPSSLPRETYAPRNLEPVSTTDIFAGGVVGVLGAGGLLSMNTAEPF